MFSEIFLAIVNFFALIVNALGYFGIFILMTIESSFIPLPSEIVLPPAGVLVAQGQMLGWLVFIVAVLGSLAGALINYFLAKHFGRRIVDILIKRYGKILFLTKERLLKTEQYFHKHGEITIFVSRLLPGIRHLVSIPAGYSKMNLLKFCVYTCIGAAIWCAILIIVGYLYANNLAAINPLLDKIGLLLLIFVILLIVLYILIKRKKRINI